mgnify:CR=1 FL=1
MHLLLQVISGELAEREFRMEGIQRSYLLLLLFIQDQIKVMFVGLVFLYYKRSV